MVGATHCKNNRRNLNSFYFSGSILGLVEAIIIHAKNHVMQLHVTCVTINLKAIDLYQKHGFRIYGTEPRSIKIGDTFFDEHLMVLKF